MPLPHNATQFPIHDILGNRWSPRAFAQSRQIEPATLRSLLEAARWSPSSFNAQPWHFLIAPRQDGSEFQKMLGCLVEANQIWAKDAAVLLISVARKNFEHNNKPNAHAGYDTGAAVAHMTFEAAARGLYVHQMAGFDAAKTRQAYGIPDTHEPLSAIAIGYIGDPNALPDALRQKEMTPSTRRPIAQFVFEGKWGQSAGVVKE